MRGEVVGWLCNCCCDGCLNDCAKHDPDHGNCFKPKRIWFSKGWNGPWWEPLIFVGIKGGDEFCNRTVGLKVPGGAIFLNLSFPMRTETCDQCLEYARPPLPPLHEKE